MKLLAVHLSSQVGLHYEVGTFLTYLTLAKYRDNSAIYCIILKYRENIAIIKKNSIAHG